MKKLIKDRFQESIDTKLKILNDEVILDQIENLAKKVIDIYNKGGTVFFAGNGGSAADAQHLAAELVSRFYLERDGLAAHALTVDTSILTAIANDYSFKKVFSRQIEANAKKGDIFIGISTSGNSENIITAIETAKKNGIYTAGLTGKDGGKMNDLLDLNIVVPSEDTPRIQESHILIGHILCEIVEAQMAK
ncbi:MAG: D-sedoheptulose-7-phosphate isomerase [Fusobacteriota bacterium]